MLRGDWARGMDETEPSVEGWGVQTGHWEWGGGREGTKGSSM